VSLFGRRPEDGSVWWFGPPWDAAVNGLCAEAPTPIDDVCVFCPAPVRLGERGLLMRAAGGREAAHLDCFLRAIVPAPASPVWDGRPAFPPNREIAEGESICAICGSGARSHRTRTHAFRPGMAWPAAGPTYHLAGDPPGITCRLCGSVSAHPMDVHSHYCGRCHLFHDDVAAVRAATRDGATHECDEWATARGRCAICGGAARSCPRCGLALGPLVQAAVAKAQRAQARKGGLTGGYARAAALTPAERRTIARRAALARWRKARARRP
jgi:hypothetical protein